uniref:Uncharacterized protein n=2 Tax=unclassified Candidatus Kentrum TaxID=2643149 RepID=A0A451ASX7_9GAMM|nr:MAG: hypothetical protein BECKLPF1236B_GA0070989_13232 [Candidatus Kentron sp. LPFa]VFK69136.1 MAG: hypothetical protein BECKUNK1418G_GA0071005_13153 [Candidatus Kentron sp. UNK]VFK73779.1 MAG: hypothetical protein BECKUNK1418H_GA0071006_12873 [Candidatus Kentron sp. UNK]
MTENVKNVLFQIPLLSPEQQARLPEDHPKGGVSYGALLSQIVGMQNSFEQVFDKLHKLDQERSAFSLVLSSVIESLPPDFSTHALAYFDEAVERVYGDTPLPDHFQSLLKGWRGRLGARIGQTH